MKIYRIALLALLLISLWSVTSWSAIGRTPLGTNAGVLGGTSITLGSSIAVGQGSTLVVFVEYDQNVAPFDGIKWNGASMTNQSSAGAGVGPSGAVLECWTLTNATGGTGSIVADATTAGAIAQWAATFVEVTGATTSNSVDKYVEINGTSTAPSVTISPGRQQANEMILGCVAWDIESVTGTWTTFAAGQPKVGTGFAINDSYLSVTTASGNKAAGKTGCTNADWGAVAISIKEAAASSTAPSRQRSIGGVPARSRTRRRGP